MKFVCREMHAEGTGPTPGGNECRCALWQATAAPTNGTTAASQAGVPGEGRPLVGQLLGHRRHRTTNRHVHLDEATVGHSAERVALAVKRRRRARR